MRGKPGRGGRRPVACGGMRPTSTSTGIAPVLAAALVRGGTDATPAEIDEVARSVARSVEAMPDTLRTGVRAAELAAGLVLRALGRGSFRAQSSARQAELAARLATLPLPAVPELVRLTRGLGLASLYEARSAVPGDGADAADEPVVRRGGDRLGTRRIGHRPHARRAGLRVLVVEEGRWVEPGEYPPYSLAQMRAQYRGAGLTVALGAPSVAYTEGCGAGGGSEVNSGLYHRPPAALLEEWRTRWHVEDLDERRLAPLSAEVERELSVAPWPLDALPAPSSVLRRGAERLGWRASTCPGGRGTASADGRVQVERQTMTRTYLRAGARRGCRAVDRDPAGALEHDGGRVSAVRLERGGRVERVTAGQVFVCGGAMQTPALLQRSGLRRNIGSNLSVHPTVKAVAELDEVVNEPADLATYQVKEFGSWLSFGGSASRPSLVALALWENWDAFGGAVERWRHQVVYYAATRSRGRGTVRAVPGRRDPLVTYRITGDDMTWLRTGMARLLHLLLAAGARTVYPSFRDAPAVTGPADAAAAVVAMTRSRASLMTVHLCGTVPMGEDRRRSGADSHGRVWGLSNLRVNDASLLPDAPGVNPQGTVMVVAQRNVDHALRS